MSDLARAVETPEDEASLARDFIPPEYWELLELAANGATDEAIKPFRKSLIGRGKPLKAKTADAAIRGARLACIPNGERETFDAQLIRLRWYLKCEMPVVFARPRGYIFTNDEIALMLRADDASTPVTVLEFDETGVDRVPTPYKRNPADHDQAPDEGAPAEDS
jgi:hypothetical protein